MTEIARAFSQVWTPATFLADVMGAVAFGLVSGPVAAWFMPHISAARLGLVTGGYLVLAVIVFWIGQGVAAYADGDTGWPRIVNRSVIQLLFALLIGMTTWLRVRSAARRHLRDLHERAVSEVDDEIASGRYRRDKR